MLDSPEGLIDSWNPKGSHSYTKWACWLRHTWHGPINLTEVIPKGTNLPSTSKITLSKCIHPSLLSWQGVTDEIVRRTFCVPVTTYFVGNWQFHVCVLTWDWSVELFASNEGNNGRGSFICETITFATRVLIWSKCQNIRFIATSTIIYTANF